MYFFAPGVLVVGAYKRGERGREAPKSPVEEELIEASANIGVQRSVCALLVVRSVFFVLFYRKVGRPPFYRHKEGRCTYTGDRGSRCLFPESRGCSGRALWEVHCGVWRWAWQSSWSSFLEIVPASWRLPRAAWSLLWGVPSSRRGVAAFRGSYRPGSCPGQGQSCFRGSCPCRSRAPRKGKYEGGMGSWQYSSWSSAEHVLHCVAGSHSVATASGMAEQ